MPRNIRKECYEKDFYFIVAIVFLMTLIPINTYAIETVKDSSDDYTVDQIIELTYEAFPEYANRMQRSQGTDICSEGNASNNELVISETRSISDNEQITYQEYADGATYSIFSKTWTITSAQSYEGVDMITGKYVVIHMSTVAVDVSMKAG